MAKKRIDSLLVEKGLCTSIEQAQKLVLSGQVLVDENLVDKPGSFVAEDSLLKIKKLKEYVGRGAYKLLSAIEHFSLDFADKICADIGSSTGGFTEVMLEKGASKVYAIDVGYGELDWKLRSDPRVVVMERTNARFLEKLPEKIEIATIDVSFISLKLVIPPLLGSLSANSNILALIKPQFEAEKSEVPKGGVINDPAVHHKVISEIENWAISEKLKVNGVMQSGLEGTKGNKEFFMLFTK